MKNYLLDEHVPPFYRIQLRRHEPGLKVWMIGDAGAPPKGTLDPEILLWCETNDFLLVTNNRQTMPVHLADHLAQGRHVPGILVIDLDAPIGVVLDHLLLIAGASREDEYRDRIEFVPLQ